MFWTNILLIVIVIEIAVLSNSIDDTLYKILKKL